MPVNVDHELPRSLPEQEGIASSTLLQFVEALEHQIHELHSFMLLRHGHVVAEGWWSPFEREAPHLLFSVSKSFTSTAVGLAVAEGRLAIDDAVLSFFPEDAPAEASHFLAAMTVRHLLTMSTGHAVDTWPYQVERSDGNWIRAFLDVPVVHAPGSHFVYNTGATYMLSAIVQKTTGMKLVDYLQPRLFEPLGIQKATWQESPQGIAVGGYGLSITTEGLARFGQLYLQKGAWDGRQVLPKAWVEAAASVQVSNGDSATPDDWTQGYGYQFWRCRHGAYQASGVFGQCCIVMPEQEAVLAFTGGIDVLESQHVLNLIWKLLLPAMGSEQPAANAAHDTLAKKLSSLALAPVHGQAASLLSSSVSRRTYAVDGNDLNIETISLNFTAAGCTASFKTSGSKETFPCGYGEWRQGQTRLFNRPGLSDDPTPVVASGAWTTEDSFTMVIRLYETPFFHTLVFHFMGDELLLETRVNVTLETMKVLLLTAHSS
jgi:CubicO group peptidase (beta-lactamase class C family)